MTVDPVLIRLIKYMTLKTVKRRSWWFLLFIKTNLLFRSLPRSSAEIRLLILNSLHWHPQNVYPTEFKSNLIRLERWSRFPGSRVQFPVGQDLDIASLQLSKFTFYLPFTFIWVTTTYKRGISSRYFVSGLNRFFRSNEKVKPLLSI